MTQSEPEAELLEHCRRATKLALSAGATGAEAYASRRKTREVAYEKNDLNLARSDEEVIIGLRVLHGQSMAFVTTNDLSSLEAAARQGVAIARLSPADTHNSLPEPSPIPQTAGLFDLALARIQIEELTILANRVVEAIRAGDHRIALDGARLQVEEGVDAVYSSTGIESSARVTYCSGFYMGMAIDGDEIGSFTYDGASGNDLVEVERALLEGVTRFVSKALGALGARKGRSFKGKIILHPETVGELLVDPLLGALAADAVRKGRSPLAKKLGAAIASPHFSLRDPGTSLGFYVIGGFDREGQPIGPLGLVNAGRLESFLFDSYEARIACRATTGHGRGPAREPPRLQSGLVEVLPGTNPASHFDNNIDLALVVPRFSGRVEMTTGDFSGVVKGGFLVENGRVTPVAETMIAGNLYEALRNVLAVSSDRQSIFGAQLFPSVVVDGIEVTAG